MLLIISGSTLAKGAAKHAGEEDGEELDQKQKDATHQDCRAHGVDFGSQNVEAVILQYKIDIMSPLTITDRIDKFAFA